MIAARLIRPGALAFALLAAACTESAPLPYTLATSPAPGTGSISVGPVTDARGEKDPNWYGAIRGGFGNPLKTLRADQPIAQAVAAVFKEGLTRRRMLAGGGARQELRVTIRQFEADRVARLEAQVNLQVQLVDLTTGRVVHEGGSKLNRITGNLIAFDTGVFASTSELAVLAGRTLGEAVDAILDDPGFRRAAAGSPIS